MCWIFVSNGVFDECLHVYIGQLSIPVHGKVVVVILGAGPKVSPK